MNTNFYAAPSHMTGGTFTVYGGYRRQRGAGILGSFRQYMAPIGRQALSGIKQIARNKTVQNIAKQAAAKGAEVLAGVAVDALQGRNIGDSLKQRSRDVALRTLVGEPMPTAIPDKPTVSSVTRNNRKRKAKSNSKRKPPPPPPPPRKRQVKQLKQRKRQAVRIKAPIAKKRRRTLSRAALNREDLF